MKKGRETFLFPAAWIRLKKRSAGTLTGKLLHQLSDLVKGPSYFQKLTVGLRDTVDLKSQPFRETGSAQKITGEKASLLYMKKQAQTCICTAEPVTKKAGFYFASRFGLRITSLWMGLRRLLNFRSYSVMTLPSMSSLS